MNARPKRPWRRLWPPGLHAGRSWRPQRPGNRKEKQHDLGNLLLFYECPQCGKKYRYELEGSADEEFGFCPECHVMGTFVGETKDNQQGEDKFADYEFV